MIKTRSLTQEEREALQNALVEKFGVDENTISTESISSTVSKEMRQDAIVAVIVATICMLLISGSDLRIFVLPAAQFLPFSMTFWWYLRSMPLPEYL